MEDLILVMTGDPAGEGSIIIVPARKLRKLVCILKEMPVVESVHAKGETIVAGAQGA